MVLKLKCSFLLALAVTVLPSYSQMPSTMGQVTQGSWMMPGGMGSMTGNSASM